jgi:BirA family transcriptional regulator, biotin operon repressor / biotin---[acetyl-CoA-carboxylase] ligase
MTSDSGTFATRHLHLDTVDSTNAEGLRRVALGERGPLWITTGHQTTGRGRSGRAWATPSGNLAATFVFAPGCRPADLHHLALLIGVAVHAAVTHAAARDIPGLRLKWPNDLLIDHAKVGGILVETTLQGAVSVAVVGIGLNIAAVPAVEGRAVARLIDYASALTPALLVPHLDRHINAWLSRWQAGADFAIVREAWLARTVLPGASISVNAGHERIEGNFEGIDHDGALLLRGPQGHLRRLTYGDVSLIGTTTAALPERTAQ